MMPKEIDRGGSSATAIGIGCELGWPVMLDKIVRNRKDRRL